MDDFLTSGGPITTAANIKDGINPAYDIAAFLLTYPQFTDVVPTVVLQNFIDLANACVKQARYKTAWIICMGFFVAHFATLYLQSAKVAGTAAVEVLAAAEARGIITGETVDGVSYTTDVSAINNDLNGWAQWKLTQFGVQFASFARIYGKGGMYVW